MKIKIWGVTCADTVNSMLYEKVTDYKIEPIWEYDDKDVFEKWLIGFNLIIHQKQKETIEHLSENTTFSYNDKEKLLYVEFHDY
jgi:hypothetical protein